LLVAVVFGSNDRRLFLFLRQYCHHHSRPGEHNST
jgi:hypothetical protein